MRFAEPESQSLLLSREDCLVLLPQRIDAFVLRSRAWGELEGFRSFVLMLTVLVGLDVARIGPLKPRVQSFEQLVLPKEHKKIVEGLVKTHSRGARPVQDAIGDDETDRREDLVRGKGKGVILLLHGVPGVARLPLQNVSPSTLTGHCLP